MGGNSFHSLFYLQPSAFLLHRFFFFFFLEAWRGPSWPLLSGHEWKGDVVSCELRLPGIKTSRVHRVHFMIAAHIRLPRLWWSMDKLTPTKSALNVATCLCTQRCRHLLWEWTSRFVGGGNCSTCLLDVHSEIRRACEKAWASIVCGWCITAIYHCYISHTWSLFHSTWEPFVVVLSCNWNPIFMRAGQVFSFLLPHTSLSSLYFDLLRQQPY